LSARIPCSARFVLLDLDDHAVEVGQDLGVHLGYPGLSLAGGDVDEGQGAVALLAQLGQELRPGDDASMFVKGRCSAFVVADGSL